MNRPIRAGDYVEHFDPELDHHWAWLQAVLEQLEEIDGALAAEAEMGCRQVVEIEGLLRR